MPSESVKNAWPRASSTPEGFRAVASGLNTNAMPSAKPGMVAAKTTMPTIITSRMGMSTRQAASMPLPTPAATIAMVMNMNRTAQKVLVQPSVARAPNFSAICSPIISRRYCSTTSSRTSGSLSLINSTCASWAASSSAFAMAGATSRS